MTSSSLTDALRETLALFEDSGTPLTTSEVADRLGLGRRSAYSRLNRLVEHGQIETKTVGANARVWWRPPRSSDADGEPPGTRTDGQRPPRQPRERQLGDESGFIGQISGEAGIRADEQARLLERWRDDLESELDEMFARIDDAFFALDEEWRFTYVNERAEDVLDRERCELIGANVWEEFPEAADSTFREQYERALDTQESVSFEAFYPPLDTWFEVRAYPSESGLSVYFRDVTERKEYERELKQYEALAETASDVLLTIDDQGRIQNVNPAVEETFGYSPQDLIGESLTTLMPERLVDAHETGIEQYLRTGERTIDWDYIELPGVRADGTEISLSISFSEYEYGGQHYFTGIIRDVTERKERERELERTKERFRKIFEHSNDAIYINDPHEDEIIDVNPAGCEMLGYSREELLSLGPSDCHPDEMDEFEAFVDNVFETGSGFTDELTCLTRDGRRLPAEMSASTLELEDRRAMLAIVRDISERKEREQALQESRNQLRALIDVLPVAVFVAEADGEIVEWNEAGEEIWGGEIAEAESIAEYAEYEAWWADTGEPVEPHEWPLARALEGEEVTDPDEIRIKGFDGTYRTVLNHGMPVRDADGEVTRAVVTLVDITKQKEYERRLKESNERLEQFAYAASHDLKEPLRMVSSYLQLLERRYADELDADGREFIEFAVDGADRMRNMVEGLLQYSRIDTRGEPFEKVDLEDVFEDVHQDLEVKIEESDAEITVGNLPEVYGDRSQLTQVFQNLLDNAIEYSGDDPARVHIAADRDGHKWVVSVRDEGIGIAPEDADRVFRLFESLHGHEDAGTGIGLALVERIVDRHGGDIWADSEPGDGTTFSFTLPAVTDRDWEQN